ncbi:hypothetical protein FRC06_002984 [Ceratobasidium sp. 370]|nr:hypothetical protein FRC06_002984 [Ceratobasidium sp. 370]
MPPVVRPAPLVSAQQSADLQSLLDACLSNDYAVNDKTARGEVYRIFKNDKAAASLAWGWLDKSLTCADEALDPPTYPFVETGESVTGNLGPAIRKKTSNSNNKAGPVLSIKDSENDTKQKAPENGKEKAHTTSRRGTDKAPRGSKRKLDSNDPKDVPETVEPEQKPHHAVVTALVKHSQLPRGKQYFNPSLRVSKDGRREGTSQVYPVDEDRVVMLAEQELLKHFEENKRLLRTITNFRFVSAKDGEKMVSVGFGKAPVDAQGGYKVHLVGLVTTANINWEMGQRAQAGFWFMDLDSMYDRPCELIWMKIPVHSIQYVRPSWWRDGTACVVVVWSGRGVYVLQGADMPYYHRHAGCLLKHTAENISKPIDILGAARPSWINVKYWADLRSDFRRMQAKYPENATAPPIPPISEADKHRLALEGRAASLSWQLRDKTERYSIVADLNSKTSVQRPRRGKKQDEQEEKMAEQLEQASALLDEMKRIKVDFDNVRAEIARLRAATAATANLSEESDDDPDVEMSTPEPAPALTSPTPSVSSTPREDPPAPRAPSVPPRAPSPASAPLPLHALADLLFSQTGDDVQAQPGAGMDVDTEASGTNTTSATVDVPRHPALFTDVPAPASTGTHQNPSRTGESPAGMPMGTSPSSSQVHGAFGKNTPPLNDSSAFGLDGFNM